MKTKHAATWRVGGGLLLALIAATGLVQAVFAARAYVYMHEASFGQSRHDPERVMQLAHRANFRYAHSYHLAAYAGTVAWEQYVEASDQGDQEAAELFLEQVRHWTRAGLHSNPYSIRLRWLNTYLLKLDDSIEAAVAYWEAHTDWHFWSVYNHDFLVDLYILAGRFEDAERALRMLRRSPEAHAEAAAALEEARAVAREGEGNLPSD